MNTNIRSFFIYITLFVPLLSTGCNHIQGPNRTRVEGTMTGAAIGAGIGALNDETEKGALIGAIAGLVIGDIIANQQTGYVQQGQAVDAATASLRAENYKLVAFNNELRNYVNKLNSAIQIARQRQIDISNDLVKAKQDAKDAKSVLLEQISIVENARSQLIEANLGNSPYMSEVNNTLNQLNYALQMINNIIYSL